MLNRPGTLEDIQWPKEGVARVPYRVFSGDDVYEHEQEKIFRGPTWQFLALEAQLPEKGDYLRARLGDTPVVVVRGDDDEFYAVVNRCAHKGTLLVYEPRGKIKQFMCIYHNWCFDLKGKLRAVAFERGIAGKGGMTSTFRREEHNLAPVRLHRVHGLIFGTLNPDTPAFEDYIGDEFLQNMKRLCGRPLVVLGQYTQILHYNWKMYMENVKDPYHASILHSFNGYMKMDRLTMEGGIKMGARGWHHISYSKMGIDPGGDIYKEEKDLRSAALNVYGQGLRDRSMVAFWDDCGDGITLAIQTIFPNFVLQQLRNSLAVRTIVPTGPRSAELHWMAFGYADDDHAKREGRLKQANFMGPAGLIAMEDGMVGSLVQQGIEGDKDKASVLELGGQGIEPIEGSRASEGSVRGFWTAYRHLMQL